MHCGRAPLFYRLWPSTWGLWGSLFEQGGQDQRDRVGVENEAKLLESQRSGSRLRDKDPQFPDLWKVWVSLDWLFPARTTWIWVWCILSGARLSSKTLIFYEMHLTMDISPQLYSHCCFCGIIIFTNLQTPLGKLRIKMMHSFHICWEPDVCPAVTWVLRIQQGTTQKKIPALEKVEKMNLINR